jgi:hypothetical protein
MKLAGAALVIAAAATLTGCGGGSSSSSGGNSGGGGGSTVAQGDGIEVGNCLNTNYDFIVQPATTELDGTSPAGVGFVLKFYDDNGAARAAAKAKNPKFTAVLLNTVIDFHGNPSPYAGAPPAKISKKELDEIKGCLEDPKRTS